MCRLIATLSIFRHLVDLTGLSIYDLFFFAF